MSLSVERGYSLAVAVAATACTATALARLCASANAATHCSRTPEQQQQPLQSSVCTPPQLAAPMPSPPPHRTLLLEPEPEQTEQTMRDAARAGELDVLRQCLLAGVRVDAEDGNGHTSLWWAASMNQTAAIDVLCEAGADLELADTRGVTALISAAGHGATDAVRCLLGHGADWRRTFDGGTATAKDAARTEGNSTTAAVLHAWEVKYGASKELEDPYQETKHALAEAMRQAARVGNADEVRRCLAAGVHPDAGPGGLTALWMAAWTNQIGPMQVLVDAGADLELANADGFTPLIAGAYAGSVAAVEFLLLNGANVGHTASGGMTEAGSECRARTALDIAKLQFKPKVVAVLEARQQRREVKGASLGRHV